MGQCSSSITWRVQHSSPAALVPVCFLFLMYNLIYLFMAVLGLAAVWAPLQLWQMGAPLQLCGLLIAGAPLVAGRRLQGMCAAVVAACGLQSTDSVVVAHRLRAQLLCSTWDLPRSRIKPVSPALAGGFLSTEPPGKPAPVSSDTR